MKCWRVLGWCSDYECHCEGTIKCFSNEDKAKELAEKLTTKEISEILGFCHNCENNVEVDIEELEIE